jgi:hypothetical protein
MYRSNPTCPDKSDMEDKMVIWDDGYICELHDFPEDCDEWCLVDQTDYYDEKDDEG